MRKPTDDCLWVFLLPLLATAHYPLFPLLTFYSPLAPG